MRRFSCFLRSGSPLCWHCETPLYAAEGQIFISRTLIWGTRGVRCKAHCAISVIPTLATPLRAGSWAKVGPPGDYSAVRTPCVAGGGVDKHGVLRLHFVIGFANDKVPLRMTGLKRVPISQHADGGGERQGPLCDQCGSHPFDFAQGRLLRKGRARMVHPRRWLCRRVKPRPHGRELGRPSGT